MSDYQAIYDAVRSRISGGNIGDAVADALRNANLSHYAEQASEAVRAAAAEHARPSAVFRPSLFKDGDKWCALYGENIQDGVAGFGASPEGACFAFDCAWCENLPDLKPGEIAGSAVDHGDDHGYYANRRSDPAEER